MANIWSPKIVTCNITNLLCTFRTLSHSCGQVERGVHMARTQASDWHLSVQIFFTTSLSLSLSHSCVLFSLPMCSSHSPFRWIDSLISTSCVLPLDSPVSLFSHPKVMHRERGAYVRQDQKVPRFCNSLNLLCLSPYHWCFCWYLLWREGVDISYTLSLRFPPPRMCDSIFVCALTKLFVYVRLRGFFYRNLLFLISAVVGRVREKMHLEKQFNFLNQQLFSHFIWPEYRVFLCVGMLSALILDLHTCFHTFFCQRWEKLTHKKAVLMVYFHSFNVFDFWISFLCLFVSFKSRCTIKI